MKLKLVAAVSALAISALAHAEQSGPQPAVPKPTKADGQKVVQIITSDKSLRILPPTPTLMKTSASLRGCPKDQPVISMASKNALVLKLLDQCGLDEQHIRGSATSPFMRTKLGFVSSSDEDVRDFCERPLFQLIVTALPASSGCALRYPLV